LEGYPPDLDTSVKGVDVEQRSCGDLQAEPNSIHFDLSACSKLFQIMDVQNAEFVSSGSFAEVWHQPDKEAAKHFLMRYRSAPVNTFRAS
jgi:hypothetical protein